MQYRLKDRVADTGWKDSRETVSEAGRTVEESLLEARERGTCVMYWLSSLVTWKLEMVSNKVVNLAKDISGQNVESANWLILTAYDKASQG